MMDVVGPDGRFAIIGAACRLPGSPSLAAFETLLSEGRCAVTEIPEGRWAKSRFLDKRPGQPGKSYTFAAGTLPEMDGFDPAFFGMSPREAEHVDPQQRLMLELVQEALEDAGLPPTGLSGRGVGVYVGASSFDYSVRAAGDVASSDVYSMQGGALSSISNRISYVYDLRGPSFTVDTACSSSMVALHLAVEALERGQIDMAVVGGVNMLLTPQPFVGFARASMLSPTGRCHAFDARADGYVRSEGGGALILVPLAAAIAMGAEIHAIVAATGMNSDGRTNGFSLPNATAQAALLRQVYGRAGIPADALGYFEAHGTGTPVGDPIEADAIGRALGQQRERPLLVGSVKPNVGHLEAASAMASLMKALITLRTRRIPRSILNETPNPRIPFANLNLSLLHAPAELPAGSLIGVNSFGFGGTNAHAVLAPAPMATRGPSQAAAQAPLPPLLLSAHTTAALRALAAQWADLAETADPQHVPALIRGAARGRDHQAQRAVLMAPNQVDLALRLRDVAEGKATEGTATDQAVDGQLAFVYSGNGSQWIGMAQDALSLSPGFAAALERVDLALSGHLGWSVATRLRVSEGTDLRNTAVAQPLLFAVQAALTLALRDSGVVPDAVVGHSAGEVCAAFASGALTLDQACWVIAVRSRHQQDTHGAGRMAALALGVAEATQALASIDPRLEISAINASGAVTVAGPADAIAALATWAQSRSVPCFELDLEYAFHSRAMDPIEGALVAELAGLAPSAPRLPLASSVTGDLVSDAAMDASYWWHNVRQPVLFQSAVAKLVAQGARILVEIGPQPVLQPYLRDALRVADATGRHFGTLSKERLTVDPVRQIVARCHAAGASIADAAVFDGTRSVRGLPTTQWQRQRYWFPSTIESIPIVDAVCDHPLLGYRAGNEPGHWRSHIGAEQQPWMTDHVVGGRAVVPAAAIIDMALAAAAALHPDSPAVEIQGLELSQFLPLETDGSRECLFDVAPDGRFRLLSRRRLDEDPPSLHAAGRLMSSPLVRRSPPAALASDRVIEPAAVYEAALAHDLAYGPVFQTVRRIVAAGTDQADVVLAPQNDLPATEGWRLHPAVVDGAFHALLVFATEMAADAAGKAENNAEKPLLVPWRFGRIVLVRPGGGLPSAARLRVRRRGVRSFAADITLFDSSGALLAEFQDCWFVRAPRPHPQRAASFFHSRLRPAAAQPHRAPMDVAPMLPAPAAASASISLSDAFLSASVAEAMLSARAFSSDALAEPLLRLPMEWLEADGFGVWQDGTWTMFPDPDRPIADDIWRTVFYDVPGAAAELNALSALAARLAAMIQDPLQAMLNDGGAIMSAPMKEQMLTASDTAAASMAALLYAVDAFGANWPQDVALRVAVTGTLSATFVVRLADCLATVTRCRIAFQVSEASAATLRDALADHPHCTVPTAGTDATDRYDLVVGIWAMGGPSPNTPDQLAILLAPGGTLIAIEPAPSRIVALLRRTGDWDISGLDADAAAEALGEAGLIVAAPHPLGGEVWEAAILAASARAEAQPVAAEATRRCVVADQGWPEMADGIRSIRPDATRLAALDPANLADLGGADVVLLLGNFPRGSNECAARMAQLVAFAVALDKVGDVRLHLVMCGDGEKDVLPVAISALRRVIANETTDLTCRAIRIESRLPMHSACTMLCDELATPDNEPDVVLSPAGRLVPRLHVGLPRVHLPATESAGEAWRLEIRRPGLLSSLHWQPFAPRPPRGDEVAIEIAAAGLNFRDVMWALGMLPDEALLDGFSGPGLGLECAGTVRAVGPDVTDLTPGDQVIAIAPAALATHVVTRRHAVLRLPAGFDMVAATTMPVAFVTAVYALGRIARIRPGERVLIHGGTGGVGLAAIQYALYRGATVYATAGDAARRQMLRRLGASEVFDSRNDAFFDEVLAATQGEGVDVVLNSLAGTLMERSLGLLRPFGRFLEIGKRDFQENTTIGLRPLRHNVSYFAIDVDELAARRPQEASEVMAEIAALIETGQIRPLPYRRYDFSDAVAAFHQMQASGHIGKFVLIPDRRALRPEAGTVLRHSEGVHIVTGGLTGFGLRAAQWLAAQGVRRLALLSRRGPATPGADEALSEFRAAGVAATAHACDVSDPEALARTLNAIRAEGVPIRGVVHAAMVLDDAALAHQDEARFRAVMAPKLAAAEALDTLTRDDPVELFLLFSSITTAIGNPGQANYVVANAALEAIATRRRALSLPGQAICWGPIGDAGYLAGAQRVSAMLEKVTGARHLTADEALGALPDALRSGLAVVGIASVHWNSVCRFLPRIADTLMAEPPPAFMPPGDSTALRAQLASLPTHEAEAVLVDILRHELAAILRLPVDSLTPEREIADLGVDSLMAVELHTALCTRLGVELPMLSLAGKSTFRSTASRLLRVVVADPSQPAAAKRDELVEIASQYEEMDLTKEVVE